MQVLYLNSNTIIQMSYPFKRLAIAIGIARLLYPKQYQYRKPKHKRIAHTIYPEQRLAFNSYWQYVHAEACRNHSVVKSPDLGHTPAYPDIPAQNHPKSPKTT